MQVFCKDLAKFQLTTYDLSKLEEYIYIFIWKNIYIHVLT